jgi:hypothetical protein
LPNKHPRPCPIAALGGLDRRECCCQVFSRTYYPNLVALYQRVGVEILDADYSFSCSRFTRDSDKPDSRKGGGGVGDGGEDDPLFGYNRHGWLVLPQLAAYFGLGKKLAAAGNGGSSPPSTAGGAGAGGAGAGGAAAAAAAAAGPVRGWKDSNLGLLMQLVRLLLRCKAYVAAAGGVRGLSGVSLGAFLASKGYTQPFLDELFYPMLSVVCTCSYDACAAYPAGVALDYFAKHGVSTRTMPLSLSWGDL